MRQHFVPRAYLKNFAIQKNNEFFVYVYDKKENKSFQTNIINIAVEKDIYTINNSDDLHLVDDKYIWEHYYADNIEPELSQLTKHIISKCDNNVINDRSVIFDDELRIKIACQLIYQIYRGKEALLEADNKRVELTEEIKNQAEELAIEFYGKNHDIDIKKYVNNDDLWRLAFAEASISGLAHKSLINRLMEK